jgi:predicted transcriptional regulator
MEIRCAIAGCDVIAGDEVSLGMKEGMLVADKGEKGIRGRVIFDGKMGEDIAVKDVSGGLQQLAGSIAVVRVPGIIEGGTRAVEIQRVRDILKKDGSRKIGAMGTSAKVLMNRLGVKCDFEFDVIQSGMLAALRGFDVTVFASGGMAERVVEKVKEKKINCSYFAL